ncbi:hypothetical protein BKA70DRAFT_1508001 [Coprinopsis sp. MPI-PUGE-AT-0042]|nr:hypothetical protein BKA70DRAFT_1508001 [Coprinopsis sp. MPI-PUGE-AT-0042]
MARVFCVPGIVFLFVALVLSFLASISVPYLSALGVVKVDFNPSDVEQGITNLRFGIWTSCYYNTDEDKTCQKSGVAYDVAVTTSDGGKSVNIGRSWTRGLAIQPVATGVTLIALCLSLSTNLFVMLLAMIASFFAAFIHLLSFVIQIALFAYVKNKMGNLDIGASTKPAPGFWLVFASLILCTLGGITVCFGRRHDRTHNAPMATEYENKLAPGTTEKKPGFMSRFRKEKV